nr:TIGR03808 family TAT-translocated repetitive protein [uncultured Devosia sp.]
MISTVLATRRTALAALAMLAATPAARAQSVLDASALGVVGGTGEDQGRALQAALEQAAAAGQTLQLPSGIIHVAGLGFPGNLIVQGVPGSTELTLLPDGEGISVYDRGTLVLRDIGFALGAVGLTIEASDDITLERCRFRGSDIGVAIADAGVTIRDCHFTELGDAAIHAMDSRGLLITGNRIDGCGNAGIRIWRGESGPDGSIVTANRIANIDWKGGGNGQNGNGINVFKADEVIIADNHIADCAFTAIRLNATNNSQVSGNTCLRSGEVAIFSEFEFSGSVIANNIIDGAATGISITNLDSGGQLAVCQGNIVRNVTPASAVNPDTIPIGIFAEAETAITGNTVQGVPGVAIAAGYGTFLRNVLISGNVVSESDIGIGVSVVDGAGPVHIGGNAVVARQHAMVGLAWSDIVEADLAANAGRYPNVTVGG